MKQAIVLILAALGIIMASAMPTQARDVPFTLEDRDRIIRLEEGQKATNQRIEEGLKSVNQRIDGGLKSTNQRIDDLGKKIDQQTTFMLWGFGILFSGMAFLMGFVLWDRRTALAPAIRKTKELEERAELIEKALKEAALENPGIKEALKHVGLL
jgi:hypothetical protein